MTNEQRTNIFCAKMTAYMWMDLSLILSYDALQVMISLLLGQPTNFADYFSIDEYTAEVTQRKAISRRNFTSMTLNVKVST